MKDLSSEPQLPLLRNLRFLRDLNISHATRDFVSQNSQIAQREEEELWKNALSDEHFRVNTCLLSYKAVHLRTNDDSNNRDIP